MYLIKWQTIVKPKKLGCLQIKARKHQNLSLLANLAWRFIEDKHQNMPWVQFLKSNYLDNSTPDIVKGG